MKWLALGLMCVGCNGGDCVVADTPVTVSGTGTTTWTEASAPTITKSVSFIVSVDGGPSVTCERIPWAALSHGVTVDVAENCVADDAPLASATLMATSTIDATNEGTLTLHFDVPSQDVALVATVSFAHAACSGSSWGFWDI